MKKTLVLMTVAALLCGATLASPTVIPCPEKKPDCAGNPKCTVKADGEYHNGQCSGDCECEALD
jgi:hypothetical protein